MTTWQREALKVQTQWVSYRVERHQYHEASREHYVWMGLTKIRDDETALLLQKGR